MGVEGNAFFFKAKVRAPVGEYLSPSERTLKTDGESAACEIRSSIFTSMEKYCQEVCFSIVRMCVSRYSGHSCSL